MDYKFQFELVPRYKYQTVQNGGLSFMNEANQKLKKKKKLNLLFLRLGYWYPKIPTKILLKKVFLKMQ